METPNIDAETSSSESSAPSPESGRQSENMAVEKFNDPEATPLTRREKFISLGRTIVENAQKIDDLRVMLVEEEGGLARLRGELGMPADTNNTELRSAMDLHALEALQQQLVREREEIIQREADTLVEERVTETFAIFKTLTPDQLAEVEKTGKLPKEKITLWSIFKNIFSARNAAQEQRFNIILARAYAKGETTFYMFSQGDVTEFNIITQEIRPTIVELATKRITEEQNPSQIEEGKDQPQLTNGEPLQIPETSSSPETSPSSSGDSGAKS